MTTALPPYASFDVIAHRYDDLWSSSAIGRAQRDAVWAEIDPLFKHGDFVLDLGCGTGVDARHLSDRGVTVYGIDQSPEMVKLARQRGIEADCCAIEALPPLDILLDGAISNFGALNCIASLNTIATGLAQSIRRGGHLALCLMNRACLWEWIYYLAKANPRKAFRRFTRTPLAALGTAVSYPSSAEICAAFADNFTLVRLIGIGFAVPPSYVSGFTGQTIERLAAFDRHVAARPPFRALSDHRLYIFRHL